MAEQSTTRVEEIYRRLRLDILNGSFQPGSRLGAVALCKRYRISSGLLREVLPRLAGEGLVVSEPQRGFRVASASVEDLRQLTEARALIEADLLRQSIEHDDVTYEAELVAAHHVLARTPALDGTGSVREEWLVAHANFHHKLLAGSKNLRLLSIADSLRDASEVYRCWANQVGRDRDVAGEHQRILDATVERDVRRATTALVRHIELTSEILISSQTNVGDPARAS